MEWLKIDRNKLREEIALGCQRMAFVCQWVNGCVLSLIGVCISGDLFNFVLECVCDEFYAEILSECKKDVQMELVFGLVWSLIGIFVLRLICIYFSRRAHADLAKELRKSYKKIEKLSEELNKYKGFESGISSVVKIYFESVAKRCGLGVAERVSFYVRQNKNLLALSERYATNPDYQTVSRETYPETEGIISLARRKISVMVDNLPDYKENPNDYLKESKLRFNLSVAAVKNLTMKARFYYAYRFSSPDQRQYNSIVVIESMNPHFRQKAQLDDVFVLDNDFIYNLVDIFKSQLPRLKISKDKEF